MRRCCVCKTPSYDDEARAPLCEVCARVLAEHELSEAEAFATRMLRTFVERMGKFGYGERMTALIESLDTVSEEDIEAATPQEILDSLGMTTAEVLLAFTTLMEVVRGVDA
jgi:hypothetical protein